MDTQCGYSGLTERYRWVQKAIWLSAMAPFERVKREKLPRCFDEIEWISSDHFEIVSYTSIEQVVASAFIADWGYTCK
jgi:hypothetical protein